VKWVHDTFGQLILKIKAKELIFKYVEHAIAAALVPPLEKVKRTAISFDRLPPVLAKREYRVSSRGSLVGRFVRKAKPSD